MARIGKTYDIGSPVLLEAAVKMAKPFAAAGAYTPANTTISVFDATGAAVVKNAAMINVDVGKLSYTLQTDETYSPGEYEVVIKIEDAEGSDVEKIKSAFYLE